jgi:hypothetical protein
MPPQILRRTPGEARSIPVARAKNGLPFSVRI